MVSLMISILVNHKSEESLHFVILTDGSDDDEGSVRRIRPLLEKYAAALAPHFRVEWDFLDADALAAEYAEEIALLK